MTLPSPLAAKLAREIERAGPIPIAQFMAEANAHYYATRDPLGTAGDFVTAPEISQMFGELVGLWLADLWMRAGSPDNVHYVELGPGRGTLAADALRAMRSVGLTPLVHFVETSPLLRAAQAGRVPHATWHDAVGGLPHDVALLVVANEFFDALPVRQLVATDLGWRERTVTCADGVFTPATGETVPESLLPEALLGAAAGTIVESSSAARAICAELSARISDQGGGAIVIDYGYQGPAAGDTLQAVRRHGYADPFANPGEHDLTAHVDFTALAREGRAAGLKVAGPAAQGEWLERLGLSARASALAAAQPAVAGEIALAQDRLAGPEQMGTLFKTLALVAPDWPDPEGFA
jgi:NADH dehydrogenase [ubiquinone] 1 alpha subcomplex assembly factor 7